MKRQQAPSGTKREPLHWRTTRPPHDVVVGPASRQESVGQQDRAAGGHERRELVFADGSVGTASIELNLFTKGRRVYAYLRCKRGGKNYRRYVGDCSGETRDEALALAWNAVHERRLLHDWIEGTRPRER